MRLPTPISACIIAAGAIILAPHFRAQSAPLSSLAQLRDHARPLIIFAPNPEDPQLRIQLRILHDAAPDVAERDIVPIAIPCDTPSPTAVTLSTTAAQAARRKFGVAPTDFTVILIGKDGGEKIRSSKPLSMQQLRDTIDAMPMRQEEIKQPRR